MTTIPAEAINLILESEGVDQPWRWPGGGSGITLGYGCDIGADPESLGYWQGVLPVTQIDLLKQAKGRTGRAAKEIETRFREIHVTQNQALKVFMERNLPREILRTQRAFPGLQYMPTQVLGAMVSLVFNRGTDLEGDRRREMRIIHEILADFASMPGEMRERVQAEYMRKIAVQFRAMKRIWMGQGLDGLLTRRDAEARLIESIV